MPTAAAPPQVEILSEGDSINELMLLVGGMVEVLKPGMDDTAEELSISMDGHSSIRGGYARHLSDPILHSTHGGAGFSSLSLACMRGASAPMHARLFAGQAPGYVAVPCSVRSMHGGLAGQSWVEETPWERWPSSRRSPSWRRSAQSASAASSWSRASPTTPLLPPSPSERAPSSQTSSLGLRRCAPGLVGPPETLNNRAGARKFAEINHPKSHGHRASHPHRAWRYVHPSLSASQQLIQPERFPDYCPAVFQHHAEFQSPTALVEAICSTVSALQDREYVARKIQ